MPACSPVLALVPPPAPAEQVIAVGGQERAAGGDRGFRGQGERFGHPRQELVDVLIGGIVQVIEAVFRVQVGAAGGVGLGALPFAEQFYRGGFPLAEFDVVPAMEAARLLSGLSRRLFRGRSGSRRVILLDGSHRCQYPFVIGAG